MADLTPELAPVIQELIDQFHRVVTANLAVRYGPAMANALRLSVYAGLVARGLCDESMSQDHLVQGIDMVQQHINGLALANWALACAEELERRKLGLQ